MQADNSGTLFTPINWLWAMKISSPVDSFYLQEIEAARQLFFIKTCSR